MIKYEELVKKFGTIRPNDDKKSESFKFKYNPNNDRNELVERYKNKPMHRLDRIEHSGRILVKNGVDFISTNRIIEEIFYHLDYVPNEGVFELIKVIATNLDDFRCIVLHGDKRDINLLNDILTALYKVYEEYLVKFTYLGYSNDIKNYDNYKGIVKIRDYGGYSFLRNLSKIDYNHKISFTPVDFIKKKREQVIFTSVENYDFIEDRLINNFGNNVQILRLKNNHPSITQKKIKPTVEVEKITFESDIKTVEDIPSELQEIYNAFIDKTGDADFVQITAEDLAKFLNISASKTLVKINKLIRIGLLIRQGRTNKTKYFINKLL